MKSALGIPPIDDVVALRCSVVSRSLLRSDWISPQTNLVSLECSGILEECQFTLAFQDQNVIRQYIGRATCGPVCIRQDC